jgi:hypothetical protein
VGRRKSRSILMVVVFPAPLGPRKPKIAASGTSMFKEFNAFLTRPRGSLYTFVRSSVLIGDVNGISNV